MSASTQIYIPGQAEVPRGPREHPGRKVRQSAATWILDHLVPTNKTILLCWKCNHRFDYKSARYVPLIQRVGYVTSDCDGCKMALVNCHMYTHESSIGTKHGQCWDPEYL